MISSVATRCRTLGEARAVFLSGNGPLVAVLQEALTRDELSRSRHGERKGVIRQKVKPFIQNVHHFRDEGIRSPEAPYEHVVIFDEAQRAWNRAKTSDFMRRRKKIRDFNQSEPEFLISYLDRHVEWAVVICLVDGGQDIAGTSLAHFRCRAESPDIGSAMSTFLVITALIVVSMVAAWILSLRRRAHAWAGEMNEIGLASVQVSIEPPAGGTQEVIFMLRGTPRPHPIAQLNVERADAARVGLEPPHGFEPSEAAADSELIVWTPSPQILLEPGVPRRLMFRFTSAASAPIRVGVHVAAPMRVGGGLLIFGVRVPVADERAREAANLRSALMAKGRELGVAAKNLPEWPSLLALEREIGG